MASKSTRTTRVVLIFAVYNRENKNHPYCFLSYFLFRMQKIKASIKYKLFAMNGGFDVALKYFVCVLLAVRESAVLLCV